MRRGSTGPLRPAGAHLRGAGRQVLSHGDRERNARGDVRLAQLEAVKRRNVGHPVSGRKPRLQPGGQVRAARPARRPRAGRPAICATCHRSRRRRRRSRPGQGPARRRPPTARRTRDTAPRLCAAGCTMPRWLGTTVRCRSVGGCRLDLRRNIVEGRASQRSTGSGRPQIRWRPSPPGSAPYSPGRQAITRRRWASCSSNRSNACRAPGGKDDVIGVMPVSAPTAARPAASLAAASCAAT